MNNTAQSSNHSPNAPVQPAGFRRFYMEVFLAEHQNRVNIGLHIVGTVLSLALILWALVSGQLWWLILYPLVHVAPGLIGHRFFERSASVGDLRINRKDYSLLWFVAGNHLLTFDVFIGRKNAQ